MDRAIADGHLAPLEIRDQLAAVDPPLGPGLGPREVPQSDAHAGKELVDTERLGDVVVRAKVERVHLVALASAGREHDDRRARALADVADDLETVAVGKVEVKEDQVGRAAVVARLRLGRVLRGLHLEVVAAQIRPQRADHGGLVVDDKEARAGRLAVRPVNGHRRGPEE